MRYMYNLKPLTRTRFISLATRESFLCKTALDLENSLGVYNVSSTLDQLVIPKETVAKLSSTLGAYYASNAVDGNKRQHISYCSHTADITGIKEAWLRIDLNKNYSIKEVKFWYREYNADFESLDKSNNNHITNSY